MTAALGAERAEALLGRAIERRGREAGRAMFAGVDSADPRAVADAFLAASPDAGALYPSETAAAADGSVTIRVTKCPLQDAWRGAGLPPERIQRLCRIAGRFDNGLFGATRVDLSTETWAPGRDGCCRIRLSPRTP